MQINFKRSCTMREIELIFSAMENASENCDGKSFLLFSKLLQKRLKQFGDYIFVHSENGSDKSSPERK